MDIIGIMKKEVLLFIIPVLLACGSRKLSDTDRFRSSAIDVTKVGRLQWLTDDDRSIYPVFGPGDTIVLFQRFLLPDMADTFAYFPDETVKPYGVNISSRQLYTLGRKIDFPSNRALKISGLPKRPGEETVWGVASPESGTFAFETIPKGNKTHLIYLVRGDSVRQLSFGEIPCFIDRFSNTGRFLTAVYGTGPTWILIFDLEANLIFRVERPLNDSASIDYMTSFSPDDSMMLFIRSDRKYSWERDYFGDIWLLSFN
jgi:hypothetical protein